MTARLFLSLILKKNKKIFFVNVKEPLCCDDAQSQTKPDDHVVQNIRKNWTCNHISNPSP